MPDASTPTSCSPTREQIQAVASAHGLGTVRGYQSLTGGNINPVFVVRAAHRSAVLKINTLHPKSAKLLAEAHALSIASAAFADTAGPFSVAVPGVIACDQSRSLLPYDLLLIEYLPGENGSTAWQAAAPANRVVLSRELGQVARLIRHVRVPGCRYGTWDAARGEFGLHDDWQQLITSRAGALFESAAQTGVLDVPTRTAVEQFLPRLDVAIPRYPERVFLHRDVMPWNTLAMLDERNRTWRLTAIFDFERAGTGPAPHEFAATLSSLADTVDTAAFFGAYSPDTRLSDDFLRQVYCYEVLNHLEMIAVFHTHYRERGATWIERRVTELKARLRGQPAAALARAGYSWPF